VKPWEINSPAGCAPVMLQPGVASGQNTPLTLTTFGSNLWAMINPFATETELKILAILAEHTGLYGLELVRESGGKLKRGTVYVTLGRLEERGLVRSKVLRKANNPGLPRPVYAITEAGYRMLEAARVATNQ